MPNTFNDTASSGKEAAKQAIFAFLKRAAEDPSSRELSKESQKRVEDAVERLKKWSRDPRELNARFGQTLFLELDEMHEKVRNPVSIAEKLALEEVSALFGEPENPEKHKALHNSLNASLEKAGVQIDALAKLVQDLFNVALDVEKPDLKGFSAAELIEIFMLLHSDMPPNDEAPASLMETIDLGMRLFFRDVPNGSVKKLFVDIEGLPSEKMADAVGEDELRVYAPNSCRGVFATMSKDELFDVFRKMEKYGLGRISSESIEGSIINLARIRKTNFIVDRLEKLTNSWISEQKRVNFDPDTTKLLRFIMMATVDNVGLVTLHQKLLDETGALPQLRY